MTIEIISWSISTKVWDRAGIELGTPGSAVGLASVARHITDCATRRGIVKLYQPFSQRIHLLLFLFENLYPYKAKMEMQIIEFRAGIKFLTNVKEIHQSMADEYGDSRPKYSTVLGRKLHKKSRQLCIWWLKKRLKTKIFLYCVK